MKLGVQTLGLVLGIGGMAATSLYGVDAPKGKELFEKKCAMCHAKDLKGNPAMAKMYQIDPSELNLISKESQSKTDAELIAITTKGKAKMPAQQGKLTPEEIANVIAYVRSAAGPGGEKTK